MPTKARIKFIFSCRQICTSTVPLHPLLPSLIDVYVNSMLNVNMKMPHEPIVNERIGEEEILEVFKDSLSEEVSIQLLFCFCGIVVRVDKLLVKY